ncbi:DUF3800 domain-containing protein [Patescibacteria group bacterium]|nr:DUF3800 domain-containing protein [Patescibacteria group bacterium]MBU2579492.1 DUF3800 domain-containing protein [Patescibacteria group bacterium]
MLIFIDESGDSGLKTEKGSSKFFTIALVVFEDREEALFCDQKIALLKKELGWSDNSEFHFKRNSDKVRRAFLQAVAPYNFFYYGVVINKDPKKLWGDGFRNKESFYKYACGLVFQNAKDKLENAIIVVDKSGNLDFRRQLTKYLRKRMNEGDKKLIKKLKMQRSESNNLLQLADYVAGVINRSIQKNKKFAKDYRKIVAHREIYVQIWPK